MTAPLLPDHGDGARRRRREELQRLERRRARWTIGVVAAAAVVAAAVLALPDRRPARPTLAGEGSAAETTVPIEQAPAGMVMAVDRDGRALAVVVVAPGLTGRGGDLVHIPVGTLLGVPDGGELTLRQIEVRDGLLGVRDALTRLFGVELVAESVPITQMPAGLATSTGGDLAQVAADQPVWDRWLAAIRAGSSDLPSPAVLGTLGDELLALSKGEVDHHVLPVESVGDNLERVRTADLDGLVARVFPGRP